MSKSDNKKQPTKKPNNSYSLLLQGLNDVVKTKPSNKNPISSKKEKPKATPSKSPENTMSSQNEDYPQEPSASNDKSGDIQDPDVPDRSYGDYYCKLCDSHMNSDNMWDAHITGKRHIKNVKKGDTDSKYEDLPDVESSIKYELRNVKDPVVGLSYIHEIRRKEPNVPPIYNCFLCHASIATVPLVTEHVISMKHRLNYVKENNPEEYQLIEATNLKKGHMEPLVIEAARKMEQKVGRGTVKVKQEKKKDPVTTWGSGSHKRSFNLDDLYDDRYQKHPKNPNFEELGPTPDVWKSVDTGRSFGRRERSRSPRDFRDTFANRSRSRSPRDFRDTFVNRSRSRSPRDFRDTFVNRSRSRSPRDFKGKKRIDDHSMDGYKRSFSKRDRSPSPPRDNYEHGSFSKRNVSPKEDIYHSYRSKTDDYLQSSRKSDSHDRLNYISSRYESPNPRDSLSISYPSLNHPKSASFQENYLSHHERPVDSPPVSSLSKSFVAAFQDTLLLTGEDCYKLFYLRLKSLPDISSISEMLALTRLISAAQLKLKHNLSPGLVAVFLNYTNRDNTAATNIIPGLGDAMSSSAKPQDIKSDNSQKTSNTASLINILKNVNMPTTQVKPSFPYPSPTSYAPAISSQPPPALGNSYQASTSSYQASTSSYQASTSSYQAPTSSYQAPISSYQAPPPVNTYQGASTSSYTDQVQYQLSNTNMPFPSGSIAALNEKNIPQSQFFNYSLSSSASKNYPRKY